VLTSAYAEQFHSIGWYQFCLGHISKKWAKAVAAYHRQATGRALDQECWSSKLIMCLWKFIKGMWQQRNQVVHGDTVEEQAQIIHWEPRDKVTHYYQLYRDSPAYVLPRHQYLFTQWTLEQQLQQSHDYVFSWICSVEEARATLSFQETIDQETAQRFFRNFLHQPSQQDQEPETSDSSYTPPSAAEDVSLALSYQTPTTLALTTTSRSEASDIDTIDLYNVRDDDFSQESILSGITSPFHPTQINDTNQVTTSAIPDNISFSQDYDTFSL
jgi:hypothetical protein